MKIETLKQYDIENAKIDAFVDRLQNNMPNRKFDLFARGFWDDFPKAFCSLSRHLVNTMPDSTLNYSAEAFNDAVRKYESSWTHFLTGGSQAHKDTKEYVMRIVGRHAADYLTEREILSPIQRDLLIHGLPNWVRGKRYVPPTVSAKVIEEVLRREEGFLDVLSIDGDMLSEELDLLSNKYSALVKKHHDDYGATKIMKKEEFDTKFIKKISENKGPSSFAHGLPYACERIGSLPKMIQQVGKYFT